MIFDTTTTRFFWIYPQHITSMFGIILVSTFYFIYLYKNSYNIQTYTNIAILSSCGSIIGAKLFGCINEILINVINKNNLSWEIILRSGNGLQGGIIGYITVFFIFSKKFMKRVETQILDITAVGFPLYFFWARISCFLSGCCYGKLSNNNLSILYTNRINGAVITEKRLPIALIEAGLHLILFFTFWSFLQRKIFKGYLLFLYLIIYSACRFFIEFLRADHYNNSCYGISLNQLMSTVILLTCLLIIYLKQKKLIMEEK